MQCSDSCRKRTVMVAVVEVVVVAMAADIHDNVSEFPP